MDCLYGSMLYSRQFQHLNQVRNPGEKEVNPLQCPHPQNQHQDLDYLPPPQSLHHGHHSHCFLISLDPGSDAALWV